MHTRTAPHLPPLGAVLKTARLVGVLGMIIVLLISSLAEPAVALAQERSTDVANLPLSFVPNEGQSNEVVQFQARAMGGTVFFLSHEVVMAFPETIASLRYEGANNANLVGADLLPGTVSYLIGDDPDAWHKDLSTYGSIVYEDLYQGVDVRYDGTAGQLKSTFVVTPGADPSVIRWRYEQVAKVELDETTGDLLIELEDGSTLIESAPVAWQEVDGERVTVDVSYALAENIEISLLLGNYDETLPLIIDPMLVYSTFLGGGGYDELDTLALDTDGEGNIYVGGATTSYDLISANPLTYQGNEDAFVIKLNPRGDTVLNSVFVGGSCDDDPNGMGVDVVGNVYIAGDTDSGGNDCTQPFPTTAGVFQEEYGGGDYDGFAAKLDGDGNLVYGTYLGGKSRDDANAIAVDEAGNAYVVGLTTSDDNWLQSVAGPYNGNGDAYVIKLDPDGKRVYGRYLGGSDGEFGGWGVKVADGHAYVVGDTASDDFPTTTGAYQTSNTGPLDLFVAKLTKDGTDLVYSTYLGGAGTDYSYGLALDEAGHAYVTGQTQSPDFPTTDGAYDRVCGTDGQCNPDNDQYNFPYVFGDAFVSKLSADGGSLIYSTFVGGSGFDKAYAIAVDDQHRARVTGDTFSPDFPMVCPIHGFRGVPGEPDVFVVMLTADGAALEDATYLGGAQADFGTGIAVDGHATWVAGVTFSPYFPITPDALQDRHAGGWGDGFLARLEPCVVGGATMPSKLPTTVYSWASLVVMLGLLLAMGGAAVANRRSA